MPARVVLILTALAVVFLSLASPSGASEQFGDLDVSSTSLEVNDRGEALVTYRGDPVFGYRTPSTTKRDPNARFFYVDTFNSVFGAGWKHDAGKVAHRRNGAFCYSFVPQMTPPGYP
ncbi:MAG: hypothetical protein LH654_12010, partial [Thermoleophilia bacterium]|nr:hypothetical protein [Thermoleophilia bacterium]